MPVDMTSPGSPGWWLEQLGQKLMSRRIKIGRLKRYLGGDAPLPEGAEGCKDAYKDFQRKARTNFGELVVEAVSERMVVTDFTAADDAVTKLLRANWVSNHMDVYSTDVHDDMLGLADGYVIVGDDGVITREDPYNVVTAHDPVRPHLIIAALKLYRDDVAGLDFAHLYTPGRIDVFTAKAAVGDPHPSRVSLLPWEFADGRSGVVEWTREVPVVRFRNRRGLGEFESHTDVIDRINFVVLQRLVITAMQAYRQRATKGDLPETDEAGNPIDYGALFSPGPGALWQLPEGVELWESQVTDVRPILEAAKDDIRDLGAVTRTPMAMLLPEGANQTAEGASFAKEGLVFKASDRIKRATYGWRHVQHLALLSLGVNADMLSITPVWAPPERFSLAERADAAAKAADVPWRTRMTEIWQFPPDQVDRMEAERAQDAMLGALAQPATPGVTGAAG